MPSDSNTDPLDLLYILKRRGISFERWCKSVGIGNQKDFFEKKTQIEAQGEYAISSEMTELARALPKAKKSNSTSSQGRCPTLPPPAPSGPSESQEQPVLNKRAKKVVST